MRANDIVSVNELAKKCGLDVTTVNRALIGDRTPNIFIAKRICEAMDMPMNTFAEILEESYPDRALPVFGQSVKVTARGNKPSGFFPPMAA